MTFRAAVEVLGSVGTQCSLNSQRSSGEVCRVDRKLLFIIVRNAATSYECNGCVDHTGRNIEGHDNQVAYLMLLFSIMLNKIKKSQYINSGGEICFFF